MTNIFESNELEQSRIGRFMDWLDSPIPQIACLVGTAAIIAIGASQANETDRPNTTTEATPTLPAKPIR